jgi:hypothetical protein
VSTGLLKIKSDDKKKRNVYNIIKVSFPKDWSGNVDLYPTHE